jgi:hypothetical protein
MYKIFFQFCIVAKSIALFIALSNLFSDGSPYKKLPTTVLGFTLKMPKKSNLLIFILVLLMESSDFINTEYLKENLKNNDKLD